MAIMTYQPPFRKYGAPVYGMYQGYRSYGGRGTKVAQGQSYSIVNTVNKRKRRIGNQSWFKKKLFALQGARHCRTNDTETLVAAAKHQTLYTCNVTANVNSGTEVDDRIGDSIQLEALKVHGVVESNGALTKPCQFRILVLFSGEEYNVPSTLASGLGSSEVFQPGTGGSWLAAAITNSKSCTVLHDEIVTLNNSISGVNELGSFSFTVPINRRFDFQTDNSVYGKRDNLYIVCIGCVSAGVTGTTTVGQIQFNSDLIYKQI